MDTIHNEFLALSAKKIQALARGWMGKRRYATIQKHTGKLQRVIRGFMADEGIESSSKNLHGIARS